MTKKLPFFTIGHSTRTIEEFVELLKAADVKLVIDVRTVPRSRTNPQYNKENLPKNLAPYKIQYRHLAKLGGLRKKEKDISPELNGFWENRSFHNYADYALTKEFQEGMDSLIALGRKKCCAIMCSEAVWWRCHRRIIADYLIAQGETVFHLMGEHKLDPAKLTVGAEIESRHKVIYPGTVTATLT